MSLSLRESFQVRVPPDRVWQFLIDPAQVVRCLPGAELLDTVDERTYHGRVKVKVGPISTAYDGTATLTEVDQAARRMQLVGEGKEVGAAGSARMGMVGTVSAHPDGGSKVEVEATIDIAGRVMQFGRGLIESVSRQLFKQFAESVRTTLEGEHSTNASSDVSTPSPSAAAVAADAAHREARSAPATPPPTQELRIVPLLWRALLDWLRRLVGRRA